MLTLINILIIFFILLILYQILLATKVVEGLENKYEDYDKNNPNNALILAQQNAGNIEYLKGRFASLEKNNIIKQVQDLSGNVDLLQSQVNSLIQAQQEYAAEMTGGTAPEVSGILEEDETLENSDTNFITE